MPADNLENLVGRIVGEKGLGRAKFYSPEKMKQLADEVIASSTPVLQQYYNHFPSMAEELVTQVCWYMWEESYDSGAGHLVKDPPRSFERIINFYGEQHSQLRQLHPLDSYTILRKMPLLIRAWMSPAGATPRNDPWPSTTILTNKLVDYCLQNKEVMPPPKESAVVQKLSSYDPFWYKDSQQTRLERWVTPTGEMWIENYWLDTSILSDTLVEHGFKNNWNVISFLSGILIGMKEHHRKNDSSLWETVDSIFATYAGWLQLQQSDFKLGRVLLEKIASLEPLLAVPNALTGISTFNLGGYVYSPFVGAYVQEDSTEPKLKSILKRIEEVKTVIALYHQHFEGVKELSFPIEETASAAMSFLRKGKHDSSKLKNFFGVLIRQQCQTLEEVLECANLGLAVETSGYKIIRKISTGSFKEVYLAQDRFGTESVLKKINSSEDARKFLQTIGSSLEGMMKKELTNSPFKIKHPNICSMFPLYSGDDFYILEEKYDQTAESFLAPYRRESIGQIHDFSKPRIIGESYSTHYSLVGSGIETSPSPYCSEAEETSGVKSVLLYPYSEIIIHLMSSMAEALEYCHRQGIVHGDIKLDNFGVKTVEEVNTYVLSDFGLATRDVSFHGSEKLTYRLGRVYTKAPELFHESSHATCGSDAWAFGSVLYYLCTGRHPFSEELVDFSQPAEKERYAKRVHDLIRAETWGEVLRANIDKYLPRGFEIGYPIYGPYIHSDPDDVLRTEAIVDRKVPADLQEILQLCFFSFDDFGRNFFMIHHDFGEIQKYISERKGELINKYSEAGGFGG